MAGNNTDLTTCEVSSIIAAMSLPVQRHTVHNCLDEVNSDDLSPVPMFLANCILGSVSLRS